MLRAAAGAMLALIAACGPPSTLPTPLNVRAHVDTVYYDVHGVAPRQWLVSIRNGAPSIGVERPWQAQTRWYSRWTYPSSRMGTMGCEPADVRVDLDVRFFMPRLADTTGVAPDDLREWRRFMTALWVHENGHAARALRAASAQYDAIRHTRASSCSMLTAETQRVSAEVFRRWRKLDDDYDAESAHGARQGTRLSIFPGRQPVDTSYHDTLPRLVVPP